MGSRHLVSVNKVPSFIHCWSMKVVENKVDGISRIRRQWYDVK